MCMCNNTNKYIKKDFEQINDSILPFYISKRKKSNKSEKPLYLECFFSLFFWMEHKEKCIQCE